MTAHSNRRTALSLLLVVAATVPAVSVAADLDPDPWLPLRRLLGAWTGSSSGVSGEAMVSRRYTQVLDGRFINELNTSVYPPQDKNRSGERHEHWGMFSFDKGRMTLVLRHFHGEGFVNTYRQAAVTDRPNVLVFESESFENFSNAWKARETYEFLGDDEFIETFELAPPNKPYQTYSRTQLKRVQ
jgi:hypothetical protein